MSIEMRGTEIITNLANSVLDAPDFSFLYEIDRYEENFFPRVNNSIYAREGLKKDEREKLAQVIAQFQGIEKLLEDARHEASSEEGVFSNNISIFHKDGEISIIAIPVTDESERLIGGYLLHHDLSQHPEYGNVIEDIYAMKEFVEPAQEYLSFWKRWFASSETRNFNRRAAGQIYLAGTNTTSRTIYAIAESFQKVAELSNGARRPDLQEWQKALLTLESTKEFPSDSVIVTIEIDDLDNLKNVFSYYRSFFLHRDRLFAELKAEVAELVNDYVNGAFMAMSIENFAEQVKGQRFPLARLKKVMADADSHNAMNPGWTRFAPQPTIGDLKRFYSIVKSDHYYEKSVWFANEIVDSFINEQASIMGLPPLAEMQKSHPDFIAKLYTYKKVSELPFPSRRQFDAFFKLTESSPRVVHLMAHSEADVKRLIGSEKQYFDEHRISAFQNFEDPALDSQLNEIAADYFSINAATYQSLLTTLGLNSLSLEQLSGFMAPEVSAAIREIEINTSGLKASLRSYQEFGVQYTLHQKKIVLGDEMGLGKTVTALGVAKHVHNENLEARSLFIVPLAVLENWKREIAKHTDLVTHVIYGDDFEENLASWVNHAGVGLVTYESLQKMNQHPMISLIKSLDFMVVDEVHYLKNPEANRTKASRPWISAAEYAMLMSGTPLENNLQEFKNLIDYVQPDLEADINSPYMEFRKAIAPAYLRRNQVDVLSELPEKIDKREYVELSTADLEYYKRAILNNDYHAARRAKMMAGEKSNTVKDIKAIVADAMANDNKVIIFSYYLDTIDVLQRVLKEDDLYTPITGSMSSMERQDMVDKFNSAKEPGVLLSQITSGGAGLNIQSASVIIIAEPQTKPSLEDQAIGRAFRMGQQKSVQVFRMRGKGTIDEAWDQMLEEKKAIFNQTAGVSSDTVLDKEMVGSMNEIMEKERQKLLAA